MYRAQTSTPGKRAVPAHPSPPRVLAAGQVVVHIGWNSADNLEEALLVGRTALSCPCALVAPQAEEYIGIAHFCGRAEDLGEQSILNHFCDLGEARMVGRIYP